MSIQENLSDQPLAVDLTDAVENVYHREKTDSRLSNMSTQISAIHACRHQQPSCES